MAMRIWHQSFTVLQELGPYADALNSQVARLTRPDTEVVLHGMAAGTYPTNYPGTDIIHCVPQYLHGTQFLAGALKAQKDGYDAFLLCTLPEPALQEIRSMLDIPVVGYCESALHTASYLGRRIGILSFIEDMIPLVEANVHQHGFTSRFGGIRHVGFAFPDVLQGFTDPAPLLERFKTAARKLIAEGVDVIIPGEAPLCTLLSQQGLSRVDGVPIIDAFATSLATAEMMVDLRRKLGLSVNRRGYYFAPPDPARTEQLLEFYGVGKGHLAPGA
jgi:allantoin racemase